MNHHESWQIGWCKLPDRVLRHHQGFLLGLHSRQQTDWQEASKSTGFSKFSSWHWQTVSREMKTDLRCSWYHWDCVVMNANELFQNFIWYTRNVDISHAKVPGNVSPVDKTKANENSKSVSLVSICFFWRLLFYTVLSRPSHAAL